MTTQQDSENEDEQKPKQGRMTPIRWDLLWTESPDVPNTKQSYNDIAYDRATPKVLLENASIGARHPKQREHNWIISRRTSADTLKQLNPRFSLLRVVVDKQSRLTI